MSASDAEPKVEGDYCTYIVLLLSIHDCSSRTIDENASGSGGGETFQPKLDKNGLPLVPQPSDDPSDPLNFPQWLKVVILVQASVMALLGPFNTAVINPGIAQIIFFHAWKISHL